MFPLTPSVATSLEVALYSQNDKVRAAEQYRTARRVQTVAHPDDRSVQSHGRHRVAKVVAATMALVAVTFGTFVAANGDVPGGDQGMRSHQRPL